MIDLGPPSSWPPFVRRLKTGDYEVHDIRGQYLDRLRTAEWMLGRARRRRYVVMYAASMGIEPDEEAERAADKLTDAKILRMWNDAGRGQRHRAALNEANQDFEDAFYNREGEQGNYLIVTGRSGYEEVSWPDGLEGWPEVHPISEEDL